MHPPLARKLSLPFSATLLIFSSCACTTTGGRILGRILDPSGAVITGVKVHLINEQTGVSRDIEKDTAGDYQLPDVPVGTYRISMSVSSCSSDYA